MDTKLRRRSVFWLPLSQEEEQWALKSGIKLRVSYPAIIPLNFSEKDDFCFVRIYLAAQKSERCYSPVGTTKTLLCPTSSRELHIDSFRSTRQKRKVSTNPTLSYRRRYSCWFTGLSRRPRHADGNFILETSSNKYLQDGTYSVVEMTIGSNQRPVFDATPRLLKTTLALCAVTWSPNASWSARAVPRLSCSSSQPSDMDQNKLKREIIRKTRHFHSRRYIHERIISSDMIVIVPRQTLPELLLRVTSGGKLLKRHSSRNRPKYSTAVSDSRGTLAMNHWTFQDLLF